VTAGKIDRNAFACSLKVEEADFALVGFLLLVLDCFDHFSVAIVFVVIESFLDWIISLLISFA
jgi:hypothetical protein